MNDMPKPPDAARPRTSPQTDPTNPQRQEAAAGQFKASEVASERHNDEFGLSEKDRVQRDRRN